VEKNTNGSKKKLRQGGNNLKTKLDLEPLGLDVTSWRGGMDAFSGLNQKIFYDVRGCQTAVYGQMEVLQGEGKGEATRRTVGRGTS